MDVERMESHVAKWLSDNCADTNATAFQNVRLFTDHASNAYKDKVALCARRSRTSLLKCGPIFFTGLRLGTILEVKEPDRYLNAMHELLKVLQNDHFL